MKWLEVQYDYFSSIIMSGLPTSKTKLPSTGKIYVKTYETAHEVLRSANWI